MNEAHQATTTHFQEIKDLVATARENEQKILGAIERISKELEELV